jgi:deazaflavin-dependent oxidoreductase (nitroreductase family)
MDLGRAAKKGYIRVLRAHEFVYVHTDGWIGHRTLWIPSLLLFSTGARTGQPRVHALTYARDGRDVLIVPSNGGAKRWPAWYHNLRAHPDVRIKIGPRAADVTAHFVTRGEPEFDRLWAIVNRNNGDRYTTYQRQTDRQMPVIVLRPR